MEKVNWLVKYKAHCGIRSFIFQCCVLGWTAFMIFISLAFLVSSIPVEDNNEAEMAAVTSMVCCCPIAFWLLLAVPLGIAAIATLGRTKPDDSNQSVS